MIFLIWFLERVLESENIFRVFFMYVKFENNILEPYAPKCIEPHSLSYLMVPLLFIHFSSVFSAVVMTHQAPISMRDPKFISVAAKVFPLPKKYLHSGPKRTNKSEFQSKKSKLLRRGKETPFKPIIGASPIKTRNNQSTTAQTKLSKVKRPKKRPRGSLTASDLWMLNRSSHKFTNTMGRKARKGRQENKKVSN